MPRQRYATTDPMLDMQQELENSLSTASRLAQRLAQPDLSRQERQWAESELKKSVRAIYWAIDDYKHTLSIVSIDPSRFHLTPEDEHIRRDFLNSAASFADDIRQHVLGLPVTSSEAVKIHSSKGMTSGGGSYKYSLLNDDDHDDPSSSAPGDRFEDILLKQQDIIKNQDEDLELVGTSVRTLKNMSYKIGDELDQQAIMLDDLGQDMDRVDSKLDGVMKKIAKLAHLDDDKRQCKAIMVLSVVLFFLVFLLIVL